MSIRARRNNQWVNAPVFVRRNNQWVNAPVFVRRNNQWVRIDQNLTMLNSGTFNATTANNHFRIRLVWQRISTNVNTTPSTSRIRLTLHWEGVNTGWSIWGAGGAGTLTANRTFHVRINGQSVSSNVTNLNLNCQRFGNSRQMISIERTFNHAADGTLRINIGAQLIGNNLSLAPGLISLPLNISDRNVNIVTG